MGGVMNSTFNDILTVLSFVISVAVAYVQVLDFLHKKRNLKIYIPSDDDSRAPGNMTYIFPSVYPAHGSTSSFATEALLVNNSALPINILSVRVKDKYNENIWGDNDFTFRFDNSEPIAVNLGEYMGEGMIWNIGEAMSKFPIRLEGYESKKVTVLIPSTGNNVNFHDIEEQDKNLKEDVNRISMIPFEIEFVTSVGKPIRKSGEAQISSLLRPEDLNADFS